MMNAIVYTSESGFTKQYAERLAALTGLPVYNLKKLSASPLQANDKIVYLGWLMAGSIKGYKAASRRLNIQAVCAVGMSAPGIQPVETICRQNNIAGIPVFYLQGGFDLSRLHGIYRFMMSTMRRTVGKKLQAKPDKTADEEAMLNMMLHGGNCVSDEALTDVLTWLSTETVQ